MDRKFFTWGFNTSGQLGLEDIIHRSSPVQIGSLTNWNFIDAGYYHSLATKTDNTIWSWGRNSYGQLGQEDTANRSSPVQIGSLTNWSSVGGGYYHSFAIKTDGSLWNWGRNQYGQLGLEDVTRRSSPTQVGSLTNWSSASGGEYFSLATKADNTIWSWGYNGNGELGLEDITRRSSPVQIGSLTNWSSVGVGRYNSLALKTDNTIWSWGYNAHGQLGLEDTTKRSSPVQIGSDTDWSSIDGGTYHFLAIKTDGTLWSWGRNSFGQLGLGDAHDIDLNRSSPTQVGSLADWSFASGGEYHSFAIKTDSTIWSWGNNNQGQLGLEDIAHRSSPVQIGSLTNWNVSAAGYFHSLATLYVGNPKNLWSWGLNDYGQLGLEDTADRSSPVQIGSLTDWSFIVGSLNYSLAIKTDNTVWSWGRNNFGQLGLEDLVNRSSPVQIGSDTDWNSAAGGYYHSVAIKTDNTIWSWGYNLYGQLGLGDAHATDLNRSSPTQVGSLTDWSSTTAGVAHSLAIKIDNTLWSWGENTYGALGLEDTAHRSSPVQIGSLTDWSSIAGCAGGWHSIAIKTDNTIWSWGYNLYGQLGLGDVTWRSSPVQIGSLTTWSSIAECAGGWHSVAIKTDNTIWSWGYNFYGQLGQEDVADRSSPVQIGSLTTWSSISAGGRHHSLALKTDNTIWSWGRNDYGALGLEDNTHRSSPVQIGSLVNWNEGGTGGYHSLAIKFVGGDIVWGHHTNITQDNKKTFTSNWTTTGVIRGTVGDQEDLEIADGESKESETWNLGSGTAIIDLDQYLTGIEVDEAQGKW